MKIGFQCQVYLKEKVWITPKEYTNKKCEKCMEKDEQ